MFLSRRRLTALSWSTLIPALAVGGCGGGGTEPSVPSDITLSTSSMAFTSIGETHQLTASVFDQRGDPLSNATVTWTSNSAIVATVSATGLVTAKGQGSAEVTASVGAASASADVSVTQTVQSLEKVSGNAQATVAGQSLLLPLVVRALDALGSPIPGVTVRFQTTQGGGIVAPEEGKTGSDGTASAIFTLGPTAGQPQEVTASVPGTQSSTTFTATATNPAAVIEVFGGNGQSAPAGGNVPSAPAVRALDANQQPVPGVLVRFEVASGAGTVAGALQTTNAAGVATLGAWSLGPTGVNTLVASVEGQTVVGEPLLFVATTNASTGYDITIRYLGTPTSSQLLAFAQAEVRWESLITGDVPDGPVNAPAGSCGDNSPPISETIDDLLIFATIQPIDGPGGILGQAGFCFARVAGDLPAVGAMFFDSEDLDVLEANGLLDEVALHEMGHVIGIGAVLWETQGLLADAVSGGGTDPHFTGVQAIAAFDAAGGTNYALGLKVPVEKDFGPGTADSHWRESVMGNELMTGLIDFGANPLSAITVRSLADQGYTVNPAAADAFALASFLRTAGGRGPLRLENDILRLPIHRIDGAGRVVEVLSR